MKSTTIIKALGLTVIFVVTALTMSSCQSKEEKVISQMREISKTVESEDFMVEDLQDIEKKYEDLLSQSAECNFSEEQLKEIGKIQAHIVKGITKQTTETMDNLLEDAMNVADGFLEEYNKESED